MTDRKSRIPRWACVLLWIPITAVLFISSCVGGGHLAFTIMGVDHSSTISGEPPGSFPVLMVTRERDGSPRAHYLYWRQYGEFRTEYPTHTPRIDVADQNELERQSESQGAAFRPSDSDIWRLSFDVESEKDAWQTVLVTYTANDDYPLWSRYRVNGDALEPVEWRNSDGRANAVRALPLWACLSLGLFLLSLWGAKRLEKVYLPA